MFESFYSFSTTPFTRGIDADSLFSSHKTDEVIARLKTAASRQWFALLTGDCGTGKSTIIRKLTAELEKNNAYKILYLADSKLTPRHFYNGLLEQLGAQGRFYLIISRYQYRPFRRLMLTVHANRTVSFKIDTARLTGRYPEVLLTSGLSCVEFTHVYVA